MHTAQSGGVEQRVRWTLPFHSPLPHLTWSATTPTRSRNKKCAAHTTAGEPRCLQFRCDFSKGSGVFWHVPEKASRKRPPSAQCREAWSNLRRGGNNLPRPDIHPSSGRPWQDSHQSRRREFPNFVVPFMSSFYFFFCLGFDISLQNNTSFREEGGIFYFPWLDQSSQSLVRESISSGRQVNVFALLGQLPL